MARLNAFWRLCNAVFPLRDFLYLLQLEEYESMSYALRVAPRYFRRGFEQRDRLKWTSRIVFLAILVCALMIGIVALGAYFFAWPTAVVLIGVVLISTPDFVFIANILSKPMFWLAHKQLQMKAKQIRARAPNTRVIAIAGSYGKTTTKNLLHDMIRRHFKTQLIDGNINTTAGIAQWMTKHFDVNTEVLIVEMDAYHPGEIAASCRMVRPDMAIVTSIGDQHLARFGSQARIVQSVQEVFAETKRDGFKVCSAAVAVMLKEHGYNHAVKIVETAMIDAPSLSDSVREDAAYAAAIAEALQVPQRFIDEAIRAFTNPDRRQKVQNVFGYAGIDDSYNICVATAHAGVLAAKRLATASGKKLVVLTAGIPELPQKLSAIENAKYGAFLAEHADAVLVLKSEHYGDVVRGIENRIFTMSASNLDEAVPMLHAQCPISEYVLLFQPELTDASY